jgi:hypothetical protein
VLRPSLVGAARFSLFWESIGVWVSGFSGVIESRFGRKCCGGRCLRIIPTFAAVGACWVLSAVVSAVLPAARRVPTASKGVRLSTAGRLWTKRRTFGVRGAAVLRSALVPAVVARAVCCCPVLRFGPGDGACGRGGVRRRRVGCRSSGPRWSIYTGGRAGGGWVLLPHMDSDFQSRPTSYPPSGVQYGTGIVSALRYSGCFGLPCFVSPRQWIGLATDWRTSRSRLSGQCAPHAAITRPAWVLR